MNFRKLLIEVLWSFGGTLFVACALRGAIAFVLGV